MMLAWIRLLRLPNHATAVADVLAGWLIVSRSTTLEPPPAAFWAAAAASLALYAAGMVLNDVADLELDRRERPQRPLPSGQIAVARAAAAGWMLLVGGVAAGAVAAVLAGHWQVLAVAGGPPPAGLGFLFPGPTTPPPPRGGPREARRRPNGCFPRAWESTWPGSPSMPGRKPAVPGGCRWDSPRR